MKLLIILNIIKKKIAIKILRRVSGIAMSVYNYDAYSVCWQFIIKLKLLIADVENPTITCPPNQVHELVDSNTKAVHWDSPVITDNSGPGWIVTVNDTRHRSGDTLTEGEYVIQYVAVDQAGNQNACTFNIHLLDSKFD